MPRASSLGMRIGAVAQPGERRFCKPEVVGSIPISSMRRAVPGVALSAEAAPGTARRGVLRIGRAGRLVVFDNLDG